MGTLTAAGIKAICGHGRYGDGLGLYLNIAKGGSKSWIQRIVVDGKRCDIGLGGFPVVSLAKAREIATANRTLVADGRNPLIERRRVRHAVPTFKEAAISRHKVRIANFKSEKHGKNWLQMIEKYAFPTLGELPIDRIDRPDVLAILDPIWRTKPETARRVRQRMVDIFASAIAHDYIKVNPAGTDIDAALPSMPKVRAHFRALEYGELPAALGTIRASQSGWAAKLALEFVALTAGRSGEVRGAVWSEIDWERRLWIIPGHRMKQGQEHRVPLSDAAINVLTQAYQLREAGDYIFPSPMKKGNGLSDVTLTKVLRATGLASKMTVHGIRTSFRTWVGEKTPTPWAVAELCLAHRVGSAVEQAYHRTDLLDLRRQVMNDWATFLQG